MLHAGVPVLDLELAAGDVLGLVHVEDLAVDVLVVVLVAVVEPYQNVA